MSLSSAYRPRVIALPAIARSYGVEYRQAATATRVVTNAADALLVCGAIQDGRAVAGALRRWLILLAQIEFSRALRAVARQCDLSFERVQIRRQRTRWGSCSSTGTISLNVCLMFTTPALVRYLFIHELCHTRFMSHCQRFWSLVASLEPAYRQLDRELSGAWQEVPSWVFM